ncbi:MAG: alpha-galactosidase [Lachnospiraceae bacterium]|nr:alpha-galactosidase [Lachnospiraceae bacterium]MDY5742067.1 alpha-galactosidase [Lachnospiraceae bacterium]
MGINFLQEKKEIHLYNDHISYVMQIMKNGQLGQLYFGKRLPESRSYAYLQEMRSRALTAYVYEDDFHFSLEHLRQEYPSYGTTDFRDPAMEILQEDGSRVTDFVYVGHRIFAGKKGLPGLPAAYVEGEAEADTIEVDLTDIRLQTTLTLSYTVFRDYDVIARSARFVNHGVQRLALTKAMSLSLDLPDKDYRMIHFSGAWARERKPEEHTLVSGIQSVGSTRGASSAHQNPFVILKRPLTDEASGEAMGFCFVYSGNFLIQAEVDTYDVTRMMVGIHPQNFCWQLRGGESFQTPEALLAYSDQGLNGLSHQFHRLFRQRLSRGIWKEKERPILLNNWEATYFDITEEKLLHIAKTAKEDGVELFVLDDGWFGARRNDRAGLGDWWASSEVLPGGVTGLAKKVEAMGLRFGLWIELEMVNKDSDLFRAHPDWILATPGRRQSHGRNQYILDFSKPEVVDAIHQMIVKILREAPISYIKWDMNRNITECFSQGFPAERQGEVFHRYILGVYDLYERLHAEFPEILFESCASGGGRFDAGLLYYAPQAWGSDDTDAVERIKIQYGSSYAYPISSIGSHVSITPNHQLHRVTPLKTRGDVACFGAFGYELDLAKLTADERELVRAQVRFMKKYRGLLQGGLFYRLLNPFKENISSWMVVGEDRQNAIVGYYRVLSEVNAPYRRLYLQGLNPDYLYRVMEQDTVLGDFYGSQLMQAGLPTSDSASGNDRSDEQPTGDFYSRVFVLETVEA